MRGWLIAAVLGAIVAAAGLSAAKGFQMGKAACEAAHNAAALERDKQRIAEEARIEELTRQLEIEANEDPIIVQRCLGPSRSMRLNAPDRD